MYGGMIMNVDKEGNDEFDRFVAYSNTLLVNRQNHSGETPNFVLKCADFFESKIATDGEFCPCVNFQMGLKRATTHNATGELRADGSLKSEDVFVALRIGSWTPYVTNALANQDKGPAKIQIFQLINRSNKQETIHEWTFETCKVKRTRYTYQGFFFSFAYSKFTDLDKASKQDGTAKGNIGFEFNFETLESAAIS